MASKRFSTIGSRFPKSKATDMVTGHSAYGADRNLPGMLHAAILRSPHAHARIKKIDVSKAEKLPGVMAVATARDLSGELGEAAYMGEVTMGMRDIAWLVLAHQKVLFDGHPVAAVAAVDQFTAEEALKHIDVEYEVLPPVMDVLKAMEDDAPILIDDQYTTDMMGAKISDKPSNVAVKGEMGHGDIDKGFAQADVIMEDTYYAGMAHQGYIEPHACVAEVTRDGKASIWTTTQGAFGVQSQVAALFGLHLSDVQVIPSEVGGAFGGKAITILDPVAYILAKKSGRPVKVVMSREETLKATGPGSPVVIKLKAGCKKTGKITAIDAKLIYDAGCIRGSAVMAAAMTGSAPYKSPNIRVSTYDVVTNKPRVHAYRAPGAPQAAFAMEQMADQVAAAIGMDPLEFRKKNAVAKGDPLSSGAPLGKVGLKQLLKKIEKSEHWNKPLRGKNKGRGLALGFWFNWGGTSAVNIKFNKDETVSMVVGSVDITGTRTSEIQMCSEELGVPPEDIAISVGATDQVAYTDVSGGSRTTLSNSVAIVDACNEIKEQFLDAAAQKFQVAKKNVQVKKNVYSVKGQPKKKATRKEILESMEGTVMVSTASKKIPASCAAAFAADLVDVEVDPDTGKTTILKLTTFQDVGKAINPTRVEAQMQGGAVQGLGWGMTEEYVYDEKGNLGNASLLDYRQPTALDLPMIGAEYVEVPAEFGPYGVRGVGEAPIIPIAGAIANAVADATGVRVRYMPLTPERVFWALHPNGGNGK